VLLRFMPARNLPVGASCVRAASGAAGEVEHAAIELSATAAAKYLRIIVHS
jgi:hypothetical protein